MLTDNWMANKTSKNIAERPISADAVTPRAWAVGSKIEVPKLATIPMRHSVSHPTVYRKFNFCFLARKYTELATIRQVPAATRA